MRTPMDMSFTDEGIDVWCQEAKGPPFLCAAPNYELMQFTGGHDKSGREIYEGDVLDWRGQYSEDAPQPVIWYYTGWYVGYVGKRLNITSLNAIEPKHMEIIGNIYENPELLK
jgi:hypothetical protein